MEMYGNIGKILNELTYKGQAVFIDALRAATIPADETRTLMAANCLLDAQYNRNGHSAEEFFKLIDPKNNRDSFVKARIAADDGNLEEAKNRYYDVLMPYIHPHFWDNHNDSIYPHIIIHEATARNIHEIPHADATKAHDTLYELSRKHHFDRAAKMAIWLGEKEQAVSLLESAIHNKHNTGENQKIEDEFMGHNFLDSYPLFIRPSFLSSLYLEQEKLTQEQEKFVSNTINSLIPYTLSFHTDELISLMYGAQLMDAAEKRGINVRIDDKSDWLTQQSSVNSVESYAEIINSFLETRIEKDQDLNSIMELDVLYSAFNLGLMNLGLHKPANVEEHKSVVKKKVISNLEEGVVYDNYDRYLAYDLDLARIAGFTEYVPLITKIDLFINPTKIELEFDPRDLLPALKCGASG